MAESVSCYATLCELAGLPAPSTDGVSLAPLLRDPQTPIAGEAVSAFPRRVDGVDVLGRSLRNARFRYVEWRRQDTGAVLARELYDYTADPAETANLVSDPAQAPVVAGLAARLSATWPAGGVTVDDR